MTTYEATAAQLAAIKHASPAITREELAEAVAFGGRELRDDIADSYPRVQKHLAGVDLCIEVDEGYHCWHHYFKGNEWVTAYTV